MMTGGFDHLVEQAGGELLGYSIRGAEGDTLLIIRAEFNGRRMVAFQGAVSAAAAVCRAERELRDGGMRWTPDKYAEEQ
jgi:hypothetical protein